MDVADTTTELVVEKSESAAKEPTIIPESPVSEEIGTKERDDKATSADRHVCNETASKQKPLQSKVLLASHTDILRPHCMFCGKRTREEPLHVERMCGCLLMIINFFLVLWR